MIAAAAAAAGLHGLMSPAADAGGAGHRGSEVSRDRDEEKNEEGMNVRGKKVGKEKEKHSVEIISRG